MSTQWRRCNKRNREYPRCPVCDKIECLVKDCEDGAVIATCWREPRGAFKIGDGCFLHWIVMPDPSAPKRPIPPPPKPPDLAEIVPDFDAERFALKCAEKFPHWRHDDLAITLGVHPVIVGVMETGCAHRCPSCKGKPRDAECWTCESLRFMPGPGEGMIHTFPMRNHAGDIIGVRTRDAKGDKRAIVGSKAGLFYEPCFVEAEPLDGLLIPDNPVYLVEGPTDTFALMTMHLPVIGRPSASGGSRFLEEWFAHTKRPAVVIADADEPNEHGLRPGREGAERLADKLLGKAKWVRVMEPLWGKDARQWLQEGATREMVETVAMNRRLWSRGSSRPSSSSSAESPSPSQGTRSAATAGTSRSGRTGGPTQSSHGNPASRTLPFATPRESPSLDLSEWA